MSDSFNYSLVRNEQGSYILRSTVETFNLQQITDKDIISFYQNFSSFSVFDTGLLPLDGTGILSIRSAGNHMQICVQHKPGTYYVNWGSHENDVAAKTYLVAQPYRIVIGDFVDGNLLGARMFYSPFPITHADMQLYHVNLPNINCRGYRGNGVGWICLYLKEDWSNIPFNEKVSRFIERCSGVETYNDANMSETDGPRFYQDQYEHDQDLTYLWDPAAWQQKTLNEGYEWTLDPELWIPIKVQSMDSQSKHFDIGEPLTLSKALLGNYQAYYTDDNIPKFYNIFARPDLSFKDDQIAKFVKKSFSMSAVQYQHNPLNNTISSSMKIRNENSSDTLQIDFTQNQDDEEELPVCDNCSEPFDSELTYDHNGNPVCFDCINESYIYIETIGEYYHESDDDIYYDSETQTYYHTNFDTVVCCNSCGTTHCKPGKDNITIINELEDGTTVCPSCIESYADSKSIPIYKCHCQSPTIYIDETLISIYTKKYIDVKYDFESDVTTFAPAKAVYCPACYLTKAVSSVVCPCGLLTSNSNLNKCVNTPVGSNQVNSACDSCIANIQLVDDFVAMGEFKPANEEQFKSSVENEVFQTSPCVIPISFTTSVESSDIQF